VLLLCFYDLTLPRQNESNVTFVGHAVVSVTPYLSRSGKGIPSKEPSHFITAQACFLLVLDLLLVARDCS
jgi:hypothetical protein